MLELSSRQLKTLEGLLAAGYRPMALPFQETALCLRRGECAAVLTPVPNGGLRVVVPSTYIIDGNLGVKIKRAGREVFLWKQRELDATPERLSELAHFQLELSEILEKGLR